MSAEKIECKIAVIFATDFVGYSKYIEKRWEWIITEPESMRKILTGLFDVFDARLVNAGKDSF